jgi:hypothetical protein
MRILGVVVLACLAIGPASAQWGSVGGFGNVVFPGLGHAPRGGTPFGNVVFPAGPQNFNAYSSVTNTRFAGRLGGVVSGFRPYNGGIGRRRGNYGSAIYAYPVFVGGDYGYGNGYDQPPAQQQPNVTVVYPPPQPPVIINQNFGPSPEQAQPPETASESNMHVYQSPSSSVESGPDETSYYLIAFKDHTIYSAVAYYVQGDTLHYFTGGNVHNQVSLSLVDRALTERLNRERNVAVQLPQ